MERTGIEPVTSGLQSRESGETRENGRQRAVPQTGIPPKVRCEGRLGKPIPNPPESNRYGVEMASGFRLG
jgi:hypothetical protein